MTIEKVTTKDEAVQAETKTGGELAPLAPAPLAVESESKEFNNMYKMATIMAGSRLVPKDFFGKRDDVFVAMMMGREIGLAPMQAMQNIAVINGRPCIWGDAALALIKASGLLEYIEELPATKEKPFATCKVKRKNEPNEVSRTFSWAQAERAGLTKKGGTWNTYPERMMQMRARAFALRDVFPDVLKGVGILDEVMDMPSKEPVKNLMPKSVEAEQADIPFDLVNQHGAAPEFQPTGDAPRDESPISEAQLKRFFAIAKESGYTSEEASEFIKGEYKLDHINELARADYEEAIKFVEGKGAEADNAR